MTDILSRLTAALADRYRIERAIGGGGMATVYLAEDLKHDRKVALKVLKPELAAVLGAERFLVEIKTTAALQHPHILPLFDSGEADGFLFYVMPFIDGETLRGKLDRETQLGVEAAVRIATEVADALHHAHGQGVVHRDIKPENILLANGRPMVADFGIALAVSAAAGGRMTETGLSLGTPHYMSPEQATAEKEISARSDIYSLASVLYEMLTGAPPHTGSSAQQIIMKIIAETPRPMAELRKSVPPNVAAAVAVALEKLPADRFTSARTFADALGNPLYGAGGRRGFTHAATAASRPILRRVAAVAPWLLLASAVVLLVQARLQPEWGAAPAPVHAVLSIDLRDVDPSSLVMAPNARFVAFESEADDAPRLHMLDLATGQASALDGTAGARAPFFSPDGRWLAFLRDGRLMRMPVGGGSVVELARIETSSFRTGTWTTRDEIIVGGSPLLRLPAGGGPPVPIVSATDSVPHRCIWPLATPNGQHVVCNVGGPEGPEDDILHVVDLNTGAIQSTGLDARNPVAFLLDHLIYRRGSEGVVMAVRFDARRARVVGEPFQLEGPSQSLSISDNGTAIFARADHTRRLVVRSGDRIRDLWTPPWPVRYPSFSPDGESVAVVRVDPGVREVWVYDITTATPTRVAPIGDAPVWSSDEQRLLYVIPIVGTMQARREVRWRRADLAGPEEGILRTDSGSISTVQPSPDGRTLALGVRNPPGVWTASLPPEAAAPALFSAPQERASAPRYSPDGRWIAYVSEETGRPEVVVRSAAGDGGRVTISDGGGTEPAWDRSGNALYFRRGNDVVRAELEYASAPRVTGRSVAQRVTTPNSYDVAPDGQGLLVAEPVTGGRVEIVVNWIEELKGRLGR